MIKIFYHQIKPGVDCPDGIAAAWAALRASERWGIGLDIEVIGCCYQSKLPSVKEGDSVLIVDFSFSRQVLEKWQEICSTLKVIDHHKTALQDLEGFSNAIFDMSECGATLTYKYLMNVQTVPAFLKYVQDRDLWKHELPATHEIHEAMSFIKHKIKSAVQNEAISRSLIFEFFDELAEMNHDKLIAYLQPIGAELLEEKRKQVQQIAARRVFFELAGREIPFVGLKADGSEDRLVSDVCAVLYEAHPDFPFVACLASDGTWSLRSDQNNPQAADVSEIAKHFGGGGHKHAAGFKALLSEMRPT